LAEDDKVKNVEVFVTDIYV